MFQLAINPAGTLRRLNSTNAFSRQWGGISTLSLIHEGNNGLDLYKFNEFIFKTLRDSGERIFRLKGILHMHEYSRMFLAHGIHMMFDGELGSEWGPDKSIGSSGCKANKRVSRLVLIGMNLKEEPCLS